MNDLVSRAIDQLLEIPGLRLLFGLVDASVRPFLAVMLIAATFYFVSRTMHYLALRRARRVLTDDFISPATVPAVTPAVPPPVAPVEQVADRAVDRPVETTAARAGRLARFKVPDAIRMQTAVAAAAVLVLVTLLLTRLPPATPPAAPAPAFEPAAPRPAPDTAFRFEDAGWRTDRGDCVATLRTLALGRRQRSLTLYVMDSSGAVIGETQLESPAISMGALLDFRFRRLDCSRVKEWQVQGEPG